MKRKKTTPKKIIRGIIRFIVGLIAGVILLTLFSQYDDIRVNVSSLVNIEFPTFSYPIHGLFPSAIYVIVTMVLLLLFSAIVHFFGSSAKVDSMRTIVNIFTALVASIPLCLLLFISFEHKLPDYIRGDYIIRGIVFALIFVAFQTALEEAFWYKMKKAYKRYKLSICHVDTSSEFSEKKVLVSKKSFDECFSAMKYNTGDVLARDFFRISEMNAFGTKEASFWNYYENGTIINMSDQELCQAFMKTDVTI